eukprot:TRINITY_DN116432_c0_g1_i1.p1 TRINITY_DN116432_c0_g1~~TRINITY_DN116432_c0_g1_i1.p1  ORF type:complete len:287 (-),score=54.17 TRINITY_DN116432_c0_g1_i1:56-916(-)
MTSKGPGAEAPKGQQKKKRDSIESTTDVIVITADAVPNKESQAPTTAAAAPPPVAAPRKPPSPYTPIRSEVGSDVWVHIYHTDAATGWLNWAVLKSMDIGIFHAGVEVYGNEWSFQYFEDTWNDPTVPGIIRCEPRQMPSYDYQESVCLGSTKLNTDQVVDILEEFYDRWPASSYHLTHKNCISFAKALVERLQPPKPFPCSLTNIIDTSNNSVVANGIVDYSWSAAKWYMGYKHQGPSASLCGMTSQDGVVEKNSKERKSAEARCSLDGGLWACCVAPPDPARRD